MFCTLNSSTFTVTVSDSGAELLSVRRADGCEYIWQGDAAYWEEHAPVLFPVCGRLFGGGYTYRGKRYELPFVHGFAKRSCFTAEQRGSNGVRLILRANEATETVYPFDFTLTVDYRLTDNRLDWNVTVGNPGEEPLPASVGLHPGFFVPPAKTDGGRFEDWELVFSEPCCPEQIGLTSTGFLTGKRQVYPLKDGRRLPLRHALFESASDSLFLADTAKTVTLRSAYDERFVRLSFPDYPFLGLWQKPYVDAPYLCVEPWAGLPSADGREDDFSSKSALFWVPPKEEKTLRCSIWFG